LNDVRRFFSSLALERFRAMPPIMPLK
jgi:hypothetical protein